MKLTVPAIVAIMMLGCQAQDASSTWLIEGTTASDCGEQLIAESFTIEILEIVHPDGHQYLVESGPCRWLASDGETLTTPQYCAFVDDGGAAHLVTLESLELDLYSDSPSLRKSGSITFASGLFCRTESNWKLSREEP